MEKVRGTSTSRAGNALATSIASHPFSEMHRLRSALVGLHAIFTRRVCICPQFAAPTDNEDEGEGEVYHQPLGADAYVWLQVHVPHFIPLLSNPAVSGSLRKTVFDACSFGRARMETLISVQKKTLLILKKCFSHFTTIHTTTIRRPQGASSGVERLQRRIT